MLIQGFATPDGTKRFVQSSPANKLNYKAIRGLMLSNVGIGTYLGNPDPATDNLVKNAVKQSVLAGINVIDTAINYRSQKAERSISQAINELLNEGHISRDQIFLCTKNGYVTNDADIKQEFWQYINSEYVKNGIITAGDISSGYHCMSVSFLEDQLDRSLNNLGVSCIDLLYLHNAVEGQTQDISREQFMKKLESVFELYEQKRREGKIQFYGMATWDCFRVQQDNQQFTSLSDVVKLANKVGGNNHGFRFIQLPFNLYFDQALLVKNQNVNGNIVSAIEAAKLLDIGVFTSVPLMQGRLLAPGIMPEFLELMPSHRAVQFIRSTPGVIAPLVGQKSPNHVSDNLEIMKIPPLSNDDFYALVKKLTS